MNPQTVAAKTPSHTAQVNAAGGALATPSAGSSVWDSSMTVPQ